MRSILVVSIVVVLVCVVTADHHKTKGDTGAATSLEDVHLSSVESLEPHKRSKRTIGHIFDMFRKMMGGLFGGNGGGGGKGKGKGKGGRQRRPGAPSSGYGAPQNNPSSGYGAPQSPSSGYGAPQQNNPRPSYGGGNARPPPPPRNPAGGLSGGYAGGQPPQRPQAPLSNYGSSQSAPSGYSGGGQQQSAPASQNIDSYGSPQAAPIGGGNLDSYGSPQAAPIGGGNLDSYGSPQGAPVGPVSASNFGRGQRPQSTEFGPSSVFYELPAPNLATEAPGGGFNQQLTPNQDSYGSPQAAPASFNSAGDSYGSPQAAPVGLNSAGDSYGSPQANPISVNSAPDSYGSPQTGVISLNSAQGISSAPQSGYGSPQFNNAPASTGYGAPTPNSAPISNSYGSSPSFNSAPVQNNYGAAAPVANSAPVQNSYGSPSNSNSNDNPFIRQPTYGNNAAPLPITNDLSGSFVPSSYGSPQPASSGYGSPSTFGSNLPTTDIDLPVTNPIVIAGRGQTNNNLDIYGSPVAPVGTSAPVPDEIISAERKPDSFESYGNEGNSNGVEESGDAPEGELTSTKLAETGEPSPLFEDLRNVDFTQADVTTEARAPIEIDLSDGVVDLTNGFDSGPAKSEIDLLTKYGDDETTAVPVIPAYEYDEEGAEEKQPEYEYIGDENVPPELPEELQLDLRTDEPELGDGKLALGQEQESYGGGEETSNNNNLSESAQYPEGEYEYYEDEYGEVPADQAATTQANYQPSEASEDGGPSYISVPLMIEEVKDSAAAPVILAGTERDAQPQYGQGDRNGQSSKRGASYHHQFLVESPVAQQQHKRHSSDWSQRIESRRKERVWRQFNLD